MRKTTIFLALLFVLPGLVNAAKPTLTCDITNPANGDTVSGIVTITVDATGKPTISIDGVQVARDYSYNWDTTAYADGSHTINANYRGAADSVTVTVDNGGGPVDNPPVVTITSPTGGSTVSGTVTIAVSVTDEDTLTPDIYIDGNYITTAATYSWDTTAYADGSHTIYAEATDSLSQIGSDEISVNVDNSGSGDPVYMPWWNDLIDAEVAHANGITGKNTVVVILDTGFGSNYVDLFPSENILTQYCHSYTKELRKDRVEWNADTEGHGTAVTGTIIGYDLNGDFVQGVAPDAKIVMFRVIYWVGGFGPKAVTYEDMINNWATAIDDAVALHNGALSGMNMVISMSLGYHYDSPANAVLEAAINDATAQGVIVSTSAGNEGPDPDTTGLPANFAASVSVAAAGWDTLTGAYGIEGIYYDIPEGDFSGLILADFSSRGIVDITGVGYNMVLPQIDGYYYMSGTSFSCPQLSGVFCLMFEAWGSQSVSWMIDKVQNTAYWGSGMFADGWGAGFVQADAATL
jgi:hypothetical protein